MHRSRDRGDDNQVGKAPAKWFTWGDCHKSAHVYGDYQQVPSVVLVEDIVSAHKVGQVNACIPLFGTQVHEPVLACLRHIGLPIILWQDKDQRPFIQKRAAALSVLTNLPVSYMFTDKDPKSIPINEIKELLK